MEHYAGQEGEDALGTSAGIERHAGAAEALVGRPPAPFTLR